MNCAFRHYFISYNYTKSPAPRKKRERSEKALISKPIILSFKDKQVKYDTDMQVLPEVYITSLKFEQIKFPTYWLSLS